jgi:hypothetical protein
VIDPRSTSEGVPSEAQTLVDAQAQAEPAVCPLRTGGPVWRWVKRLGAAYLAFCVIKGLIWLALGGAVLGWFT